MHCVGRTWNFCVLKTVKVTTSLWKVKVSNKHKSRERTSRHNTNTYSTTGTPVFENKTQESYEPRQVITAVIIKTVLCGVKPWNLIEFQTRLTPTCSFYMVSHLIIRQQPRLNAPVYGTWYPHGDVMTCLISHVTQTIKHGAKCREATACSDVADT